MKKSVNVFKKLGLFLLLALALLLLVRCEKEPIDPPKYIIEASAGVGGIISPSGKIEVVSGDNLNFTLSPDSGFKADSITVNGIDSPLTSNTYNLSNVTNDYKIEVTFKKTLLGLLIQKPWKTSLLQARIVGTTNWWSSSPPDIPVETYVYNSSYNMKLYNPQGGLIGDYSYILKQDSLIMGPNTQGKDGIRGKIILLSEDNLVLKFVSKYIDGNGYDSTKNMDIKYTYTH